MRVTLRRHFAQVTLILALGAISHPATAKDVATVNGQGISEQDLLQAAENLGPRVQGMLTNPAMRKQFLDHLIDSRLMAKAAEDKGVAKSKGFEARLAEARTQILASLYMDKYVAEHTDDKALEASFKKDPAKYSSEEVKASHILLKDEKKAEEILKEAQKKGANFEELAKKNSTDSSASKGGDLGFFGRGRMIPEFEAAAFSIKKGELYPKVVKSQFGYHIIKVTDVKGGEAPKFADVKDAVKTNLEQELRAELVKDLREKAKVQVNDEALNNLKL